MLKVCLEKGTVLHYETCLNRMCNGALNGALCWDNNVNFFVDVHTHVDWPSIINVSTLSSFLQNSPPHLCHPTAQYSLCNALFQISIHLTASSPSSPSIGTQHVLPDHASTPNTSSILLAVDSFDNSFLSLQTQLIKIYFSFVGCIVQLVQCGTGCPSQLHSNLTHVACTLLLTLSLIIFLNPPTQLMQGIQR